MSSQDEIAEIIYQWVAKAENDWKNASYMLRLKTDCPTDTVCFHAQQCVEKYIKALLVLKGTDFPKTHDIARLMALLPAVWRPRITDAEQEKLTDYAAISRYPGIMSRLRCRKPKTRSKSLDVSAKKFELYCPNHHLKRENDHFFLQPFIFIRVTLTSIRLKPYILFYVLSPFDFFGLLNKFLQVFFHGLVLVGL